MKILHVTKRFEKKIFGGVETVIDDISTYMNKNKKYESHVFTLVKEEAKERSYKIFYEKNLFEFSSCPLSIKAFFSFIKLKKNYDVINFHFPWPLMDLLSFFVPSKKILITYHADITKRNLLFFLYLPFMIFFLFRAKKIIATSPNYISSSWVLKIFKSKTIVVSPGIKEIKYKLNYRQDNRFKHIINKKFFIFVGSLREYKGINYILKAFKQTKFNLVIVGEGPQESELLKYSNEKNFFWFKKLNNDEKFFLIENSICLLLTSIDRREAFGVSLIEALSLSKPIISSDVATGTTYVNIDQLTGLVVRPKNIEDIIDKTSQIYENETMVKKFGINGYARYKNLFTHEKMIANYMQCYREMINK